MAHHLDSLITILDEILQPEYETWILDDHKKPQLQSLFQKSTCLKQHLADASHLRRGNKEIDKIEIQIRDAAHDAEDIIKAHMMDRMLSSPSSSCSFVISIPDLSKVMETFDAANDKLVKINKGREAGETVDVIVSPISSKQEEIVVGFDEDTLHLKGRLTSTTSKLEIIPFTGMGGIGKTTLARNLYNDRLIVSHFDARAWVTVSQDYNVRAILLTLLSCIIGKLSDDMLKEKNSKLALTLYQSLCGKRYLVVLDDIWSEQAWDEIKSFFPIEAHKSRILATTREMDVARYLNSTGEEHRMRLLSSAQSWDLLRRTVFGEECCPSFLEPIGRKIAVACGGLPLAVNIIGGLLSVADNSKDLWEQIAVDVRSVVARNDERFSKVLTLSYDHLPYHLKPCFLYMAAFPEDYEVRASKLVKLWVAEGFLRSSGDKSLEDVAEESLKALVDRNLLSVTRTKSNGTAKSYGMHDLLRELCVIKSNEEKFLCVESRRVDNVLPHKFRRVSIHPSFRIRDILDAKENMLLSRSFLCIGLVSRVILSPLFFELKLLRVLDVVNMEFHSFPMEILQLVSLRFLAFTSRKELPSEISRLRNLQTLIVWFSTRYVHTVLPREVWEMRELRHIKLNYYNIGNMVNYRFPRVLEKLRTISWIHIVDFFDSDIANNIPNIRSLGILLGYTSVVVFDLSHLHKLETLKLSSNNYKEADEALSLLKLPPGVKKIVLRSCPLSVKLLRTLGALQHLEVLKLRECKFPRQETSVHRHIGAREWEPNEGEFLSLQYLLLENSELVRWKADNTHFPRLRHLVIRKCDRLMEIPRSFGDISALEVIELNESNRSLVASVGEIQDEQRDYGNESLQVRICS